MASRDFSKAKDALQQQGLSVAQGKNDQFDFYRAISQELYGSNDHPKSARKEILEYEIEKEFHYFQLFLTPGLQNNSFKEKTPKKILEEDIKAKPRCPSVRELYACAEKLKIDIYIYGKLDEQSTWTWFRFAPVLSNDGLTSDRYLMFLRYRLHNFNYDFAKIDIKNSNQNKENCSSKQLPDVLNNHIFQHSLCFTFRFNVEDAWSRDFKNTSIQHSQSVQEDWKIPDREFLVIDNSFFRCISKELYDTDGYFMLIREAICDFQLHDDYIDVFAQFVIGSEQISGKPQNHLQEHIKLVREGEKIGKGEIFAAASLIHAPIYVYTESAKSDKWKMYPPLTSYTEGSAYIVLLEFAAYQYDRLVPSDKHCNCLVMPPGIKGNLQTLDQDINGLIMETLEKNKSCCQGKFRNDRHVHLNGVADGMFMNDIVCTTEERCTHLYPDETESLVISILEKEGRTLNMIPDGDGTLYRCLSREIFGQQKVKHEVLYQIKSKCKEQFITEVGNSERRDLSLEATSDATDRLVQLHGTMLLRASTWLGVPIYIFTETGAVGSGRYKWKRFMTSVDNQKCRFYVTLYYKREDNVFSPIVPKSGCNCRLFPPISIFQDHFQENRSCDMLDTTMDLHEPMIEFLEDKLPSDEPFPREERNIPVPHVYTDTYIVMKRHDMSERVIDRVGLDSHSFYRCISKEIFGTENFFIFIRKLICDEIRHKSDSYAELLCENGSKRQKHRELENHIQNVEKDDEADEFEILLTATFFQVPIYVLCLSVDNTTKWKEYTQLRRKPKPNTLPKRISKCRQLERSEKYFVTLLLTPSGHYDRIVPASEVCNCLLAKPTLDVKEQFCYPDMSENENHSLLLMREVESSLRKLNIALNNWLMTNIAMQKLCKDIIYELEGNREKINIATIAGSTSGIFGATIAIAGLIAGPVTFGASLGLTIAGSVVGGLGGATSISARIAEAVLIKKALAQMEFTRTQLHKRSNTLKEVLTDIAEKIKQLDDNAKCLIHSGDADTLDKSMLQSVVDIAKAAKDFYAIPLAMVRFSIHGASVASAILGPFTVMFDIGFMAYSIWSLSKGSKTDVSQNLRRLDSILQASQNQITAWANGNHK